MPPEPVLFQSDADLVEMVDLLARGRPSANGAYYVHPGDLRWWYSYFLPEADPRRQTFLWREPGGRLDGWALISLHHRTFDLFVRPELRGSPQAGAMLVWTVEQASRTIGADGRQFGTVWVSEQDDWMQGLLAGLGFSVGRDFMFRMVRRLDELVEPPRLAEGFVVRPVVGEHEAPRRAAAQAAAFESTLPFDRYLDRYLRFMRSSHYPSGLDLVVLAPDHTVAAFCVCWTDFLNRTGLFEPVGVAPGFQRMGLGKALMLAGLGQLQARGMAAAQVCVSSENQAALHLYQAAGFRSEERLLKWVRV